MKFRLCPDLTRQQNFLYLPDVTNYQINDFMQAKKTNTAKLSWSFLEYEPLVKALLLHVKIWCIAGKMIVAVKTYPNPFTLNTYHPTIHLDP